MSGYGPSELSLIGLDPGAFRKVTPNEWHGPCPKCGGADRFAVHAVRQWPGWLWMCRVCSPEWAWADQLNDDLKRKLTDQEKREFAEERARMEAARRAEIDRRLKDFTAAEIYAAYNRRMTDDNREWWRRRGISDRWQDYLKLGYTPDKPLGNGAHSPAYTIPYLRPGKEAVTMQYRLTDPPNPNDKYRFESGLPAAWYWVNYSVPMCDEAIICEGAIKAAVTAIRGGVRENVSVLAVPSKNSWAGIQQQVKDCGRVWIVLDPDGTAEAHKLAGTIGKAARVVRLHAKIDDMLLGGFDPEGLKAAFRYARKNV